MVVGVMVVVDMLQMLDRWSEDGREERHITPAD